jgi:hypothetical protein
MSDDEYEFYDDEEDDRKRYGDDEDERGGGEENESDIEDYREERDEDEEFKTDGFRQREQANRPEDEDLELQYRGVIEGGGDLAKIQQRHDMMYQDPLDKFKLEVQSLLRTNTFDYDEKDESIIKRTINKIPFIQYKNPVAYVNSYYLYPVLSDPSSIKSKDLKERLKELEKHTSKNSNTTMFEIIKYAYYWKDVLIALK